MDLPFVSAAALDQHIREKAYVAFIKRAGRDSHGMNPWAPRARDFEAEYDRLEAEARISPRSHAAPAERRCVAVAQVGEPC